ncbi:unnamed protein product, partial [Durusdinium trenchii]
MPCTWCVKGIPNHLHLSQGAFNAFALLGALLVLLVALAFGPAPLDLPDEVADLCEAVAWFRDTELSYTVASTDNLDLWVKGCRAAFLEMEPEAQELLRGIQKSGRHRTNEMLQEPGIEERTRGWKNSTLYAVDAGLLEEAPPPPFVEISEIRKVGDETWTLLYEAGRPVWRRAAPAKSTPGAPGPEATGVDPEGFWKASRGGSRFLQITGEQWGSLASLQLVLDEPPEALYNKWIKERMEFYKRVEPCAAARDERLELVGKMNQRMRFSTSNNLGSVSDAIWQVILCNEEMRGIRAIQQVAQKVT